MQRTWVSPLPEAIGEDAPEAAQHVMTADLTLRQASERAGCSIKTLRRAIAAGALPRRYEPLPGGGGQLLVAAGDLERWMQQRAGGRVDNGLTTGQKGHEGADVAMSPALRSMVGAMAQRLEAQDTLLSQTQAQLATAIEGQAALRAEAREQIAWLEQQVQELAGRLEQVEAQKSKPGWWARLWGRR
jgi:hypothetical protein